MHTARTEHPGDPGVYRAEAQVSLAVRVVGVQQPRDLRGRLVGRELQAVVGLGCDAIENGAQVLPPEAGANRLAGGAVPHDGAGPLSGDAHSQYRAGLCQCRVRNFQHSGGHTDRIELDETGERRRRGEGAVVQRGDLTIWAHDSGSQA